MKGSNTLLSSHMLSNMLFLGNVSYIVVHSWYIGYLKTGVIYSSVIGSPCKYIMTGQEYFFSLHQPALELYSPSEMISEIIMLDLDRTFSRVLSSLLKQAIIKISAIAELNK